jgi:hypothetical protein
MRSALRWEIVGLGLDVLYQFLPFCPQDAQAIHQWLDLAVIQEMLMTHHPASFGRHIARMELSAEIPQVLSGVIEIHDLDGSRKLFLGQVPDPFRAISHAQALWEEIPVMTCDEKFSLYKGLKVLW